jgi:hypothetical protein
MTQQVCTKCKEPKSVKAFHKHSGYKSGYRTDCSDCVSIYDKLRRAKPSYKARIVARRERYREISKLRSREWRERNKEKVRENNIKRYGISLKAFEDMFNNQNGCCAICNLQLIKFGGPMQNEKAHVDHCHVTGNVRGLLCGQCNIGLGAFKDSMKSLQNAIIYLGEQ